MIRRFLPLAIAAACGCELYDGRARVSLVPETPTSSSLGVFTVRVESELDVDLELLVDGEPLLERLAPGSRVTLDWSGGPEATRIVRARCFDGAMELRSGDLELRVDRTPPRVRKTDPPPGSRVPPGPLSATITFEEPLERVEGLYLASAPAARPALSYELDGAVLKVSETAVEASPDRKLYVEGWAYDRAGLMARFQAGGWVVASGASASEPAERE